MRLQAQFCQELRRLALNGCRNIRGIGLRHLASSYAVTAGRCGLIDLTTVCNKWPCLQSCCHLQG